MSIDHRSGGISVIASTPLRNNCQKASGVFALGKRQLMPIIAMGSIFTFFVLGVLANPLEEQLSNRFFPLDGEAFGQENLCFSV